MSLHEIGALIRCNPQLAKRKILDAISEANGNRERAARILRAGPRSLYRWIERLEIWSDVDAITDPLPAPPRAKTRIVNALRRANGDTKQAAQSLCVHERTLTQRMRALGVSQPESAANAVAAHP